jgi:hypothetical protein
MNNLTPEAVKAALDKTSVFDLVSMAPDLAREYLRLKEENAILRTEKHADAEAVAHLKEVEKAAQWVANNPHAHPTNMVAVCRAAVEGE